MIKVFSRPPDHHVEISGGPTEVLVDWGHRTTLISSPALSYLICCRMPWGSLRSSWLETLPISTSPWSLSYRTDQQKRGTQESVRGDDNALHVVACNASAAIGGQWATQLMNMSHWKLILVVNELRSLWKCHNGSWYRWLMSYAAYEHVTMEADIGG